MHFEICFFPQSQWLLCVVLNSINNHKRLCVTQKAPHHWGRQCCAAGHVVLCESAYTLPQTTKGNN